MNKDNKNKTVSYICPILRLQHKPSRALKRKMKPSLNVVGVANRNIGQI